MTKIEKLDELESKGVYELFPNINFPNEIGLKIIYMGECINGGLQFIGRNKKNERPFYLLVNKASLSLRQWDEELTFLDYRGAPNQLSFLYQPTPCEKVLSEMLMEAGI